MYQRNKTWNIQMQILDWFSIYSTQELSKLRYNTPHMELDVSHQVTRHARHGVDRMEIPLDDHY